MGRYSVIVSNSASSVTSSEAVLLVIEPIITAQPVSVFTNAGETANFSVTAIGTAPLTYQWRKDGTNLPGATASTLVLPNAQQDDIGAYTVVVGSPFGGVPSQVANLGLNLAMPDCLSVGNQRRSARLALQPDGKILIGGNFSHLGTKWFWGFGRLNPDGSRDTDFTGARQQLGRHGRHATGRQHPRRWVVHLRERLAAQQDLPILSRMAASIRPSTRPSPRAR